MKKIKVLHILHAVGGVEVSLRLIIQNTNPDRFEHHIIHGEDHTCSPFYDACEKEVPTYPSAIVRNINLLADAKAYWQISTLINRINPDLVHAHSTKGGVFAKTISHKKNIPCLHTPQAYSFLSASNNFKRSLFLKIEQFLAKLNNKILASSASERKRALDEVGYSKDRVLVFPNAINPIENQDHQLSISKTWPKDYICSVGRPSYQKNIELMIHGLQKLKAKNPKIHLVLMGVGLYSPNLKKIKRIIVNSQLEDHITVLEWTDRNDIFSIVSDAQLYVSTARYEGLPYSIIEALALKKAVVATNSDGNRDLVKNNYNGFLIEQSADEFAQQVDILLKDVSLRKKFEDNAYIRFNNEFNIKKTISNLEQIYINEAAEQFES